MLEEYLQHSDIIDYSHESIQSLAKELSKGCLDDEHITRNCFEWVRDNISHTGDIKGNIATCKASDVLKHKMGWCYAKSHLLAALLRANDIPCGFAYQQLKCDEYVKESRCLHGLNMVYLKQHGWYKMDARGNKEGVNAQFTPPVEHLAFVLEESEYNVEGNFVHPLNEVVKFLTSYSTYEQMKENIPYLK